jgi:anaerobic selenocysteine-containing dehydrogenase
VKVDDYVDRVYSPDRVLYPRRRTWTKGSGNFERITWDAALDEIATRLKEVIAQFGPQAILPYRSILAAIKEFARNILTLEV